jgi:hypothetical protein
LLVTVAAVMAVMLVSTAPAAFAQERQEPPEDFPGKAEGREEKGPPLPFGGTEPEAAFHACKGLTAC